MFFEVMKCLKYFICFNLVFFSFGFIIIIWSIIIEVGIVFVEGKDFLWDDLEIWCVVFFMGKGEVMEFVKVDKSLFLLVGVVVKLIFDKNGKFLFVFVDYLIIENV